MMIAAAMIRAFTSPALPSYHPLSPGMYENSNESTLPATILSCSAVIIPLQIKLNFNNCRLAGGGEATSATSLIICPWLYHPQATSPGVLHTIGFLIIAAWRGLRILSLLRHPAKHLGEKHHMSSYTHTIIIADCDPLSSREIVSEIKNVTHDTRKLVTHVTIQILVMRYNCSIMTKKILKERYLVTGRMMIHLTSEESGALTILAMREHRDPREQAAYLVRQGLIALNLITEDDNETD